MTKHTLSSFHPLRITLCAALSLGLVACVGGDKDTIGDTAGDSDSDSDSGSDSDSDSSTGGVTGDASGTSTTGGTDSESASEGGESASTGEETLSTGDGTSTDSTGGTTEGTTDSTTDSTTGDTEGDEGPIADSCAVACDVVYPCNPGEFGSLEGCIAECIEGSTIDDAEAVCNDAIIEFNLCLGMATCDTLGDESACGDELDELEAACEFDGECTMGVGGDAQSCGISEECEDSSQELKCEGDDCLCIEDGEEVGSCVNDICVDELDTDALFEKAFTCCGFEF